MYYAGFLENLGTKFTAKNFEKSVFAQSRGDGDQEVSDVYLFFKLDNLTFGCANTILNYCFPTVLEVFVTAEISM